MASVNGVNGFNISQLQNYLTSTGSTSSTASTGSSDFASQMSSSGFDGQLPPPGGPNGQMGPPPDGASGNGPPSGTPPFLDAASSALGMSSSDLQSQLQSGKSLGDIASAQGVSSDTLKSALMQDLQTKNPNLTSTQASQIVTGLISGAPPSFQASSTQVGVISG